MIKIDISTALFLYLFFSVIIVLIAWLFMDFGIRLSTFSSEEKYIWHCTICTHTYIDSRNDEISVCPRCHSYIERAGKKIERPSMLSSKARGGTNSAL